MAFKKQVGFSYYTPLEGESALSRKAVKSIRMLELSVCGVDKYCSFIIIIIYLFWLHRVLVEARGIFVVAWGIFYLQHVDFLVAACMQDLVPWPGIEPRPSALGAWSLTHWTTRVVPSGQVLFLNLGMMARAEMARVEETVFAIGLCLAFSCRRWEWLKEELEGSQRCWEHRECGHICGQVHENGTQGLRTPCQVHMLPLRVCDLRCHFSEAQSLHL